MCFLDLSAEVVVINASDLGHSKLRRVAVEIRRNDSEIFESLWIRGERQMNEDFDVEPDRPETRLEGAGKTMGRNLEPVRDKGVETVRNRSVRFITSFGVSK